MLKLFTKYRIHIIAVCLLVLFALVFSKPKKLVSTKDLIKFEQQIKADFMKREATIQYNLSRRIELANKKLEKVQDSLNAAILKYQRTDALLSIELQNLKKLQNVKTISYKDSSDAALLERLQSKD